MTDFKQDFSINAAQHATLKLIIRDKDATPVNGVYPALDVSGASMLEWRAAPGRNQAATVTKALGTGVSFTTDGTDGAVEVDITPADLTNPVLTYHQVWLTLGGRTWPVLDGAITVIGGLS